jgi:hypothetical protein
MYVIPEFPEFQRRKQLTINVMREEGIKECHQKSEQTPKTRSKKRNLSKKVSVT